MITNQEDSTERKDATLSMPKIKTCISYTLLVEVRLLNADDKH